MSFLIENTDAPLWHDLIQNAAEKCTICLSCELQHYLANLLERYVNQPDLAKRMLAVAYLEAMQLKAHQRELCLQIVGDECLLFAGLFPLAAERKYVGVDYFIKLGRHAYQAVSHKTDDLYAVLSSQFVLLADILQTARGEPDLLPLEAYDRWQKTGSERAYKMLLLYTKGEVIK